jgi:hypothetical protein
MLLLIRVREYEHGLMELTWQRLMLVRRERNRLRLLDVLVDLDLGIVCILLCNDVERLATLRVIVSIKD